MDTISTVLVIVLVASAPPPLLAPAPPLPLRALPAAFATDAEAVWAVGNPRHVLLRPRTLQLATAAASMRVIVSAAPDYTVQNKILGLYRLFINGIFVAVGYVCAVLYGAAALRGSSTRNNAWYAGLIMLTGARY